MKHKAIHNTARIVKDSIDGFMGHAALYKLDPAIAWGHEGGDGPKQTSYVVVSSVDALFSGPETYIFPASETGDVLDWGELEGSYRGGYDHGHALSRAGYEIVAGLLDTVARRD